MLRHLLEHQPCPSKGLLDNENPPPKGPARLTLSRGPSLEAPSHEAGLSAATEAQLWRVRRNAEARAWKYMNTIAFVISDGSRLMAYLQKIAAFLMERQSVYFGLANSSFWFKLQTALFASFSQTAFLAISARKCPTWSYGYSSALSCSIQPSVPPGHQNLALAKPTYLCCLSSILENNPSNSKLRLLCPPTKFNWHA